jgi:ABC-type transport system involved in cytochrome c biogenesis permease subunit
VTWWSRGLVDLALTGYLWAAVQAVLELMGRPQRWSVPTRAIVVTAWALHTIGLGLRALARGEPPVAGLHAALSMIVWATVLLVLWGSRRHGMRSLAAFALPPAALLGLLAAAAPDAAVSRGVGVPTLWAHAVAVTLGLGALGGNFAASLMYVVQERSLKQGRLGGLSRRLPSLESLDRLSFQALVVGFPFLTLGIVLGTVSAAWVHGLAWLWQPTPVVAAVTWLVYGLALALRGAGRWGGRRAAYLAVLGFVGLVATVGVSLLLPTRHVVL